jgi:amidophosphoribosyltransferase
MKEACGVFGIYAPGADIAHLTFDGIFALQHRGQESAGMAVAEGETITVVKDNGLVASVFDDRTLQSLSGSMAIGHTRYSTAGSGDWRSAQPVYKPVGVSGFALSHNGNLTNTEVLAEKLGVLPGMGLTDSDLLAELIGRAYSLHLDEGGTMREALFEALPNVEGAFSLTILDGTHVWGVRDPHGFRPLCLGRLGDEDDPTGWAIASESPAFDVIGATFVREIEPGEIVRIGPEGVVSESYVDAGRASSHLCIFEFVYFARPDSILHDREVHGTRRRMGQLLALQAPVEADMVMGVPDSGVPAAEGFALSSGIPYGQGLIKNRYIGRTFINPDQSARDKGVRRKLNPLKENIAGKRLVVVDDSIVRGTTTRALVRMLRDAGAAEIHLRISSPPFKWPCFYGIDTPTRTELLAANHSIAEITEYLGCDTLAYITLENLVAAIGEKTGFCDACLTGNYPTPVSIDTERARTRNESIKTRGLAAANRGA